MKASSSVNLSAEMAILLFGIILMIATTLISLQTPYSPLGGRPLSSAQNASERPEAAIMLADLQE